MKYRPDIDGLRALAVVPVVLFHAHLGFIRGGFAGVDVFFVISGYLITLMILTEMEAGRFTIAKFYQRRILRIFPALLTVMAFAAVLGWLYSTPDDYKRLGESITSVSAFLSNVYFWKDSGYFGVAPEAKPLLHTWSLSVEEQFYVLFPIYLLLIRKLGRRSQIVITLSIWTLSLLLSIAGVAIEPAAAFFFLPGRIWELLTGSLLAMQAFPSPVRRFEPILASWGGLLLIVLAMLLLDETVPFPGLAAVAPVLGAALVIWAGSTAAPAGNRILSNGWFVLLGKISYPLYLWHFPVFAFALYLSVGDLPAIQWLGLAALSVLLAFLTWKFIETPVRTRGRNLSAPAVIALGCASMGITGAAGFTAYMMKGFEFRVSPERVALVRGMVDRMPEARQCMETGAADIARGRFCALGAGTVPANTLIWGDSFAEAVAPGILAAASRTNKRVLLAGRYGCMLQPRRPVEIMQRDGLCQEHNNAVLGGLETRDDIHNVILVTRWPSGTGAGEAQHSIESGANWSSPENRAGIFAANIEELQKSLSGMGKTVWVVGPIPLGKYHIPRTLYVQSLGFDTGVEIRPLTLEHKAAFGWVTAFLDRLKETAMVRTIELDTSLCGTNACKIVDQSHPFYFDNNHLSVHGATFVSSRFDPVFQ